MSDCETGIFYVSEGAVSLIHGAYMTLDSQEVLRVHVKSDLHKP